MRVLILVMSALVLTACSSSSTRPLKPYTDPSSAAVIPPFLGDLQLAKIGRYSDMKLGHHYAYRGENVDLCSLFVYDAGYIVLTDGIESKPVEDEFLSAKADVVKGKIIGRYKSLEMQEDKVRTVQGPGGEAKYLESDFSYISNDEPKTSFLFITASRDSFFKVRCTYPESVSAEGEKVVSRFMQALTDEIILTAPNPD